METSEGSKKWTKYFSPYGADDLIFFAEALKEQAMVIRKVLEKFCAISDRKVMLKSKLFCYGNTPKELAKRISKMMNVSLTTNLGKYLGVPILHERET